MTNTTLQEQSRETHRIEAFYNALKAVGSMDIASIRGESWFDDLYSAEHSPEFEARSDENWMDDLDEAA
jgi:hypothetical protein